MKLYTIVGSPNSRKVLAVINHLGIDLDIKYLDLFQGETQNPSYQALNPNAMVPTLVDGDFKLWESNAIIQYLTDKSGDVELFPKDEKLRADIVRWQCWELAHFNQAFGTLGLEAVAKPNFMNIQGDEAVINWSKNQLNRFATVLNNHMSDREYIVGNSISLADYSMIHVEFFKEQVPFDWSPFPHLNAYFERMRACPHWLQTAPKNLEDIGKVPKP